MLASATQRAIFDPQTMSRIEALLLGSIFAIAACVAIVVLYLVKSALGINLMPGASLLHDLLYPLVRGY